MYFLWPKLKGSLLFESMEFFDINHTIYTYKKCIIWAPKTACARLKFRQSILCIFTHKYNSHSTWPMMIQCIFIIQTYRDPTHEIMEFFYMTSPQYICMTKWPIWTPKPHGPGSNFTREFYIYSQTKIKAIQPGPWWFNVFLISQT